jgi:DNA-binding LytR/AlgR family response regulator
MKYRCAIVDDEFLARQYIKDYVCRLPFLELVGDYDSPLLILEELTNNNLDVIFLDIQMPDISGLDFLKTLNPQPCIILTTAYKEYALEGYEYNVIDYLLKPFSFDRFLKAVNKAVERIERERAAADAKKENEISIEPIMQSDHLIVRADRKWYKINFDDLMFVEGQKAYVTFHTRAKKITALISLKELEDTLPPDRFIRIHKSYIISTKNIETIEGNLVGIFNHKLPIGTSYREKLNSLFNIKQQEEDSSLNEEIPQ